MLIYAQTKVYTMNLNALNTLFSISAFNILTVFFLAHSIFLSINHIPRIVQGIVITLCVWGAYHCVQLILILMESNDSS